MMHGIIDEEQGTQTPAPGQNMVNGTLRPSNESQALARQREHRHHIGPLGRSTEDAFGSAVAVAQLLTQLRVAAAFVAATEHEPQSRPAFYLMFFVCLLPCLLPVLLIEGKKERTRD
jgi:hypothetical protein